jgi:hypothetical protein
MSLLSHIKGKYKSVAIIGMAKNAGKTVALNSIISEAVGQNLTLAITSIGRDGESIDIATNTPKPLIYIPENTLIATASTALERGDAIIEILENSGILTSMGDVIIGRAVRGGYCEIAGPSTNNGLKKIQQRFMTYNPDITIFDGALNRSSLASPTVAKACILSTGAVLSRRIEKIVEETIHRVELLSLEGLGPRDKDICIKALEEGAVSIIDKDYNRNNLGVKTALSSGSIIGRNINEHSKYVVISGALTKTAMEQMLPSLMKYKQIQIVVYDGTKIFLEPMEWKNYKRLDIKFRAIEDIKVAALTVNPYSPEGYYIESSHLMEALRLALENIEVYDVMGGG